MVVMIQAGHNLFLKLLEDISPFFQKMELKNFSPFFQKMELKNFRPFFQKMETSAQIYLAVRQGLSASNPIGNIVISMNN